jgi:hypothetical protein
MRTLSLLMNITHFTRTKILPSEMPQIICRDDPKTIAAQAVLELNSLAEDERRGKCPLAEKDSIEDRILN